MSDATPVRYEFFENVGTPSAPSWASAPLPSGIVPIGDGEVDFAIDLADVDGDGDLDLFIGPLRGPEIYFRENTGTPEAAAFGPLQTDPFGIQPPPPEDVGPRGDGHLTPTLADADGDGDLDYFRGDYGGHIVYQENVGSPLSPSFDLPQVGYRDLGIPALAKRTPRPLWATSTATGSSIWC